MHRVQPVDSPEHFNFLFPIPVQFSRPYKQVQGLSEAAGDLLHSSQAACRFSGGMVSALVS